MNIHKETKAYGRYINCLIDHPFWFHTGMWIVLLFVLTVLSSINGSWPFSFYLLNMIVALPAMLLFTYMMDLFGNKLLFDIKKPVLYFLVLICLTVICASLIPILNHLFLFGLIYLRVFESNPWFNLKQILQSFIIIWFPYFIILIKTFFVNWFKAEQEKLIVQNKQLLSEIQLMKMKLHPHFLFNTLNNLYAMAKRNNKNTPGYIMKLSELYRVMLYECNKDFYPLLEEINLIENYIELEKIRYDERLKLDFSIPRNIDSSLMIPPLLFFTFVENAFKHGCRNDVGQPYINVSVEMDADNITFLSQNSKPNKEFTPNNYGGIGLESTNKRLELIFKDEYVFENEVIEDYYRVRLQIPKLYIS